ncbi:heme oxygenase [Deinobacterium chartae]|uniref:Heme oxygenase n=1 Tax=Deinobacterium chartae TaxID=521158 RepID=A0A841HXP0_9DEIO|nr:biliverdin-producing heme oxygenase [Deinobacterium chartae]MBB6097633.1 heme oxygenase [Deinobacterium chartae]
MILTRLKKHTENVHGRVEQRLPLMDPSLSLDQYVRVLEAMYGFYRPLEAQLRVLLPASGEFGRRSKLAWLVQDLQALGRGLPVALAGKPVLEGRAQAWGALYVLEGATLGGQLISRHLQRCLGLERGCGAAFFCSYGDQVGPMWKTFRQALEAYAEQSGAEPEILAGAGQTFEALEGWLIARTGER